MVRTLFSAFVAGAVLASVMASSLAQNNAVPVTIDNFVFGPDRLVIKAGTTVNWINRDDIPHTVASKDRMFKSKVMDTDESYSFTFTTPGEYTYFCSLHPHMTGTIVVEAATGRAASQ
jgi:plastocyanin